MLTQEQKDKWATGWDYRLIDEDDWSEYINEPVKPITIAMLTLWAIISIFERDLGFLYFYFCI